MLNAIKEKVFSSSGQERDIHLGEPGFLRQLVRRRKIESVFLFVTSRCNSNCRTCFYPKERVSGGDLELDQIRRISETAPRFDKLWLSGGEPILRTDLFEIVDVFYRRNGVKTVNFPTNGLAHEPVIRVVERLLEACPKLNIYLNFSLDGLGDMHDYIRGVPGGFAKTVAAIEAVERRFGGNPRLQHNVASVLTKDNLEDMLDLGLYLLERFRLTTHFFEIMRGDPRDPEIRRPSRQELETLHDRLLPLYEEMAERLFGHMPIGLRHFAKFYFVGMLRFLYRTQEANVDGPSPWKMACTAGQTTFVIDHNGAFRACELRPPVGQLQDFNFDLSAAAGSPAMRDEIRAIGGGAKANCWCTHTCWMISSLKFSPRAMLLDVTRAYLDATRKSVALAGRSYDPEKLKPGRLDAARRDTPFAVSPPGPSRTQPSGDASPA